ncbi:MAG TPA: DUF4176 domain-containing protein [Bacillota bacterium]|nr:DUF4176 domain-containing protein [Bacillota bacterium]
MLPMGSVVILENGEQKLMIVGRKPIVKNIHKENVYMDYIGCVFPVGMVDGEVYFFNHDDIDDVLFEGYRGEDEEEILSFIEGWEQLTLLSKGRVNDDFLVE